MHSFQIMQPSSDVNLKIRNKGGKFEECGSGSCNAYGVTDENVNTTDMKFWCYCCKLG